MRSKKREKRAKKREVELKLNLAEIFHPMRKIFGCAIFWIFKEFLSGLDETPSQELAQNLVSRIVDNRIVANTLIANRLFHKILQNSYCIPHPWKSNAQLSQQCLAYHILSIPHPWKSNAQLSQQCLAYHILSIPHPWKSNAQLSQQCHFITSRASSVMQKMMTTITLLHSDKTAFGKKLSSHQNCL